MRPTPPTFEEWHEPAPDRVGKTHLEFLHMLDGPTWLTLRGEDRSRRRAIVTLLHGNEPSGLKAVHRILASGKRPATDLGIFIASVNAARHQPVFSHRFLPDEEDLNRCFNPPRNTNQRKLASALLEKLSEFEPEAIIDTHNTSAHSEPFGVATSDGVKVLQLTQLFTRRLVVLDLTLGTLIEQRGNFGPVVTIEFGGLMDPKADAIADEALSKFVGLHRLFDAEAMPMMILRHPHRLEIADDSTLHYSSSVQDEADLTIFNTIDQLNFSSVQQGTPLGWLGKTGLAPLRVMSAGGKDLLNDYFGEEDGFLVTSQPLTLFMATTDPYIAKKDCLLYLTPGIQDKPSHA